MSAEGHELTEYCRVFTSKWTSHSVSHYVLPYDAANGVYEVKSAPNKQNRSGSNSYVVQFDARSNRKGTCTCGKFQCYKIPCSHAVACCTFAGSNWRHYVSPFYRVSKVQLMYDVSFQPILGPKDWIAHTGRPAIPNPGLRRGKGRPRHTRIRNEMDWREVGRPSKCKTCGRTEHNSRTCARRRGGAGPSSSNQA
ncbi:hypothetical protein LINPERHAP1_LOCUS14823 [Linum perenne]